MFVDATVFGGELVTFDLGEFDTIVAGGDRERVVAVAVGDGRRNDVAVEVEQLHGLARDTGIPLALVIVPLVIVAICVVGQATRDGAGRQLFRAAVEAVVPEPAVARHFAAVDDGELATGRRRAAVAGITVERVVLVVAAFLADLDHAVFVAVLVLEDHVRIGVDLAARTDIAAILLDVAALVAAIIGVPTPPGLGRKTTVVILDRHRRRARTAPRELGAIREARYAAVPR